MTHRAMSFRSRLAVSVGVTGLAAAVLPWGASASAEEEPGYSGFTSTATASAVRIEIYEPSIPIPATPEMELHLAYSKAIADSGSGKGRASWLWPGDPIGEGLKTIVEQSGLPPQLGEAGYPLQVNSNYPTGPESQKDEPTPGSVMRTTATEGHVVAEMGFSPDGRTQDPAEADSNGGVTALQQFGQVITGQQQAAAEDETAEGDEPAPTPPAVPDPLSVLVDFGGYESTSRSVDTGDAVTASSRAALGDVALLGGLVTMSGLDSWSEASSDGVRGTGAGEASYGTMRIAGQKFRFGPDGFEAPGAPPSIPGLPDDPTAALEKLGIKLTFPKPAKVVEGDSITTTVAALEIQLDMDPLTTLLDTGRLNDILGPIVEKFPFPPEAAPLKSLLTSLGNLSPRFVITLASSRSTVDTVQGIDIPEPPPSMEEPPATDGPKTGPGTTTGGGPPPSTGGDPGLAPETGGDPTTATPDLVSSTPGLPELFSMPGLLLVAGIAGASLLGTYIRKLGLLALGAGAACPHGLESGVPDLRKVT